MINEFWINLPVNDVKKSVDFFTQLGFTFNTNHGTSEHSACMMVGQKNVVVMLFSKEFFETFTKAKTAKNNKRREVLLSLDTNSRAEIDKMAKKVTKAGGTIFAPPADNQGWMYGFGFEDLDGHHWNMLYMDMEKMPK